MACHWYLHAVILALGRGRLTSKYPHFFMGTLQPSLADWKGRPRCVFLFLARVQFLCLASPGEDPPGVGSHPERSHFQAITNISPKFKLW